MGLLARSARATPVTSKPIENGGYIAEFLDLALEPQLDLIAKHGIKVVTNAGGLDPSGLKNAIEAAIAKRGLSDKLKVAAVVGDDMLPRREDLRREGQLRDFDPLGGMDDPEEGAAASDKLLSLNAYLGGEPIAAALKQGADIVVTGRCVDSALVLGPLAFEFGWNFDTSPPSLDRLASASLAGHIIECGVQATGGNYTDWKVSAYSPNGGWTNMGYPILSYYPDNAFTISKPAGTGGVVNPQSVCEQMLYEVLDPGNYILPDVVLDLTQVRIAQLSTDVVHVKGARGKPPTPWLKCTSVRQNGFRILVDFLVCGEEAESKARALGNAIIARTNLLAANMKSGDGTPIAEDDAEVIVIGAENSLYPISRGAQRREVVVRVAARHQDRGVLNILGKEAASFLTNSAPGICMLTMGRPKSSPNFVANSVLVGRTAVEPVVLVADHSPLKVPFVLEGSEEVQPSVTAEKAVGKHLTWRQRARNDGLLVKLHEVAIGRSGDKGDTANVAIIARDPAFYEHILDQLTPEVVYARLEHFIAAGGSVTRFKVPSTYAVNFVVTRALGGGGLSSLRLDR